MSEEDMKRVDVSDFFDSSRINNIRGRLSEKIDDPAVMVVGYINEEEYLPGKTCPHCGSKASDVSWATAPGQYVCNGTLPSGEPCPVNSWIEEDD